jgi:hypothetical protein
MILKKLNETLIDKADKTLVEGYIITRPSKLWYAKFLGKRGHCSVILKKGGLWVWFDASIGFFNVELYPKSTRWCSMFPEAEFHYFRIWRENKVMRVPHIIQPFTCVEAVKAFLGCRKWWIVTPNQLIKEVT